MPKKFVTERRGSDANQYRRRDVMSKDTGYLGADYTLSEALEVFIRAKEAEGVRPRTVKDYRNHVEYLGRFLSDKLGVSDVRISDMRSDDVREYIRYLLNDRQPYEGVEGREQDGRGLAVSTINIRLRTLKTMASFWFREGMIERNFTEGIRLVKDNEREEVPGFTDEEVARLLSSCDERQFAGWRDKTLMLLLLDTGLRINEAVNLSVDQIDVKTNTLVVPSEIAKNRKYRDVPISRELVKRLIQLHSESKQYFGSTSHVFMNAYGDYYTAESFRRRLHRIKKRLGIPKASPHMFRHTFCRDYILQGGDIFTLQKIVDHADVKTTRKYVQMDLEHIRGQHSKFSPVRKYL